jgi:UDP:flavonoid glycosyltransferase YjiC (YdhE family)
MEHATLDREQKRAGTGKRIVLVTWGSFGDIHPFLGVARGLKARGHRPLLVTTGMYREKVEGEGIEFRPLRPDMPPPYSPESREEIRRAMDAKTGTEYVIRTMLMPHIREQYADILAAAEGTDFLITHGITHAGRVAAEKLGLPWAGVVLQPMAFVSAYDPPVPPDRPGLIHFFKHVPPAITRHLMDSLKGRLRSWVAPVDRLRAEEGLPPGPHPIFEGQFSPYLTLALFSPVFGPPQPDWPANTVAPGFPFYDRYTAGAGMPEGLERFLDDGEPPVVFTLGTSAVATAGDFYRESIGAVRKLGRRAVLLIGRDEWNALPQPLPESVFACDYAPHGDLFPRAAAIVHQCGVGTTGQSLRAGKPVLAVPFAHDQPDNAHRMTRLGMARTLPRHRYTADRVAGELRRLLDEPSYTASAARIGERVRAENGVETACDAVERALGVSA